MMKTCLAATCLGAGVLTAVFGPSTLRDRGELLAEKAEQAALEQTSTEDLVTLRFMELQGQAEKLEKLKQRVFDEEGLIELALAENNARRETLAAQEDVLAHARLKLASPGDTILVGSRQYSRADVEQDISARLERCHALRTAIEDAENHIGPRQAGLADLRIRAGTEESNLKLALQDLEATRARALNAEAIRAFRQEINEMLASSDSQRASAADRELHGRIQEYERQLDASGHRPLIDWSEGPADLSSRLEAYFQKHMPKTDATPAESLALTGSSSDQ